MFVLKQHHRSLGYESKTTKYIVAFDMPGMARRVRSSIDPNRRLRLERGKILYQMSTEDICLMPLEMNIGVIMPHALISEDADTMSFQCRVIDPCSA